MSKAESLTVSDKSCCLIYDLRRRVAIIGYKVSSFEWFRLTCTNAHAQTSPPSVSHPLSHSAHMSVRISEVCLPFCWPVVHRKYY